MKRIHQLSWLLALTFGLSPNLNAQEKGGSSNKSEPKRFAVAFQNKPWKEVFGWLSDQTALPVIAKATPTGSFTFTPPPGRTYTIVEVIDLVNEALSNQHVLILRRPASLLILPADERVDPALVPQVRPDELAARGKTELVSVMLPFKKLKPREVAADVRKMLSSFGSVTSLGDRLVIQDVAGNLARVVHALREMDEPPGARRAAEEAPSLRSYALPTGSAESVARVLQDAYRKHADVRIVAVSKQTLLVWGPTEIHFEIARHCANAPPLVVEVIPLATLPPVRTAETLQGMFGHGGGLYLEGDSSRQALVVRGTKEQIGEIKSAIVALGDVPSASGTRIITVKGASAAVLAEAVQRIVIESIGTKVQVIIAGKPGGSKSTVKESPTKGGNQSVLTLTAVGNKLIATCDNPETLAFVQEVTRLLMATGGNDDFEVIRLRFGNPTDVAKALTELMNGPPANPGPERVRIIADPSTNSVLVKAAPIDLLNVRNLIRTALDTEADAAVAESQTFIIGPFKHTQAAEMAKIVREVFRGAESRQPGFSVSSDQRTNSLILRCSPALLRDIQSLVKELDEKVKN